jgi:hypothetical protein
VFSRAASRLTNVPAKRGAVRRNNWLSSWRRAAGDRGATAALFFILQRGLIKNHTPDNGKKKTMLH